MKTAALAIALALSITGNAFGAPPNGPAKGTFSPLEPVPIAKNDGPVDASYRLGPLDIISVNVFGQEKLSPQKIQVDASGGVVLPLIGAIQVGGKTANEVSNEVAARLDEKYLQSSNVSVLIVEAVSQRVTVTGAVMESGMYSLRGPTSLMQAVSMAKGPDVKVADLKNVTIFRDVDGQREAATFDLDAIRHGKGPDPIVHGGDTIVIPTSAGKSAWREVVNALPALSFLQFVR